MMGTAITGESGSNAEPFEVAIVITGADKTSFRIFEFSSSLHVFPLDVTRNIFGSESRTPQKVEHRSREMLIGLPNNSASLRDRQLIAERSLEITQGHAPAMPIQERTSAPRETAPDESTLFATAAGRTSPLRSARAIQSCNEYASSGNAPRSLNTLLRDRELRRLLFGRRDSNSAIFRRHRFVIEDDAGAGHAGFGFL